MQDKWTQEIRYFTKQANEAIKLSKDSLHDLEKYFVSERSQHLLINKANDLEDKVIQLVVSLQKLIKFTQEKPASFTEAHNKIPHNCDESSIFENGPRAYRVKDACKMLGIGHSTFYKLNKAGKIDTIKMGGRRLISSSEVKRLLEEGCA